jgi:hypothetical protein
MSGQCSLVSLASFLSSRLLPNNLPHKVWETEAKKITTTVDVVIPSGSTLTNCHNQICVGDGSDK